nr:hypothetical protein [Candidatus Methylomirabilis limnetica]
MGFTKRRLNLTKSRKIRRVDMSDQLCHAFQQAKEIREAELSIDGRGFDYDEPVFRNSAGHRLDESRYGRTILRRCLLLWPAFDASASMVSATPSPACSWPMGRAWST